MTFEEAKARLEACGQAHLLAYYDELDEAGKKDLLRQIEETDFSVLDALKGRGEGKPAGSYSPIRALEIPEIEKDRASYEEKGFAAIRAGKVALVLLAGGMGTRLGSSDPKCMLDIGLTRPVYIMQRLIENLREVTDRAGCLVPLLIMTSDVNHDRTVAFMEEHVCFGYDPSMITYFRQDMAPAASYEGKVLLEDKGKIALSPNGNGGWYSSLHRAGILDRLKESGVEWLNVFGVDNVLQRIADPCFIGAVLAHDCSVGAKAVRKNHRDEKVGALCLENGRPAIIEYYEMTDEMLDAVDERGERAYNFGVILNYLFRIRDLDRTLTEAFPVHVVEKKIPCIDEKGAPVRPQSPNGYKFELLMIDQIRALDTCLPYEVVREREFAPIKNKTGRDSVESARDLCARNGIIL